MTVGLVVWIHYPSTFPRSTTLETSIALSLPEQGLDQNLRPIPSVLRAHSTQQSTLYIVNGTARSGRQGFEPPQLIFRETP